MTIIQRILVTKLRDHRQTNPEHLQVYIGIAETKELKELMGSQGEIWQKLKPSPLPAGWAMGMEWYCTEEPSELRIEARA